MKNTLFILFAIISLSCKKEEIKPVYSLPNQSDINQIIESVISFDTLSFGKKDYSFSLNIKQPDITFRKKNSEPPLPPNVETIYFGELLSLKDGINKIFTEKDSAYVAFQKNNFKEYKPTGKSLGDIKYVSQSNAPGEVISIYSPIFTKDQKHAYLQSAVYYSGHWQGTYGYTLSKIKGIWKVINTEILWVL